MTEKHPLDDQYEKECKMRRKTGGPAFPRPCDDQKILGEDGMDLRDYFAAKVIQGYLASMREDQDPVEFASSIARDSYLLADAMLEARKL